MTRVVPDGFPPEEQSYSLYEGIEYQGFWDDPHLSRQDVLEQHLVESMLPAAGRRILDLGCGYGRLAPCYLGRFDESVLCDGSMSLLHEARVSLGEGPVLVASDAKRLPFRAGAFDCTLAVRVLHHIKDLDEALSEIARVAVRRASFVFSYHNKRNAKTLARFIAGREEANPFSREATEPIPTLISRHPKIFDEALIRAGFGKPVYRGAVVVDPLARLTERFEHSQPAGTHWAGLMGSSRLAPWLIGRTSTRLGRSFAPSDSVEDLFVCPVCHSDLAGAASSGFECRSCARTYPVEEGIFDFRS